MAKRLNLKEDEIKYLNGYVKKGSKSTRAITRARILLFLHAKMKDAEIQKILCIGRSTIWRVKMNYFGQGIDYALSERDRPGQPVLYNEKIKAEVVAFACTTPPKGNKRWSVRLLAEELSKNKEIGKINRESVRLILKKTTQSLG